MAPAAIIKIENLIALVFIRTYHQSIELNAPKKLAPIMSTNST
jgi:hypothetical protein